MTRSTTQFSVFLLSKPAALSQVCDALGRDRVNIIALSMMDSTEHGVLRLIAEDPARARATLKKLNMPLAETEVLMTELANRPGSLAEVCARLGGGHVAINYAYCTGASANGRSLAVLKVSDIKRAMALLEGPRPKRRETPLLRPRAARARA